MKKLLLSLALLLPFLVTAETIDLNFDKWPNMSYNNSYSARTYTTDDYTLVISKASKQTSTVKDVPVVKASDITLKMKNDVKLSSVKVNFIQWGSKTQTAKISYSTDGTNFTEISGKSLTNFTIETGELPEGVVAVRASTIDTSNQIGIASIVYEPIIIGDDRTKVTLSFPEESYSVNIGEEFIAPELSISDENAISYVEYKSSEPKVADFENGELVIKGSGKTIISAYIPENEVYKAEDASYILTIIDPNATESVINIDFFGETSSQAYKKNRNKTDKYGVTYNAVFSESGSEMTFNTGNKNGGKSSQIVVSANNTNYIISTIEIEGSNLDIDVYAQDKGFAAINPEQSIKEPTKSGTLVTGTKGFYVINAKAFAIWPDNAGKGAIKNVKVTYVDTSIKDASVSFDNGNLVFSSVGATTIDCVLIQDDNEVALETINGGTATIALDSKSDVIVEAIFRNQYGSEVEVVKSFAISNADEEGAYVATEKVLKPAVVDSTDEYIVLRAPKGSHIAYFHTLSGEGETPAAFEYEYEKWYDSRNIGDHLYTYALPKVQEGEAPIRIEFYVATPKAVAASARAKAPANYEEGYELSSKAAIVTVAHEGTTGIDAIEAEGEGAARYFNLQGVEVAQPAAGQVYIMVVNGVATKVVK